MASSPADSDGEGKLVIDEREEGEIEDIDEEESYRRQDGESRNDSYEERREEGEVDTSDDSDSDEDIEIDVVGDDDDEKEKTPRPTMESLPTTFSSFPSFPSFATSTSSFHPSDLSALCLASMASSSTSSILSSSTATLPPDHSEMDEMPEGFSTLAGGSEKEKKGKITWNIADMLHFYEAVKQYGKDFETLYQVMARRRCEIGRDQLRNFFFNFYKTVRAAAEIREEDWAPEIPRDARDLFVVINGCEWRKRMGNYKFDAKPLKELIMKGHTEAKMKLRRVQQISIKTPCCPALIQFFTFNRRISRFPPDIVLYLSPKTFQDGTNVLSRGASPNLCIRLNTCDRIERVFDCLRLKWKKKEKDQHGKEREVRPFSLKFFPSRRTIMGDITYTPSPSSFINVCINKLLEDRQKTDTVKLQISRGHELTETCYEAAQTLIPHLSISRASLRAGVSKEDVGDASVAELFAVCGLSREIHLAYSIDEPRQEEVDSPWGLLADMITRGYGEAAADKRPIPTITYKNPRDFKKKGAKDSKDAGSGSTAPAPKKPRFTTPRFSTTPRHTTQPFQISQSPIVTQEMEQFEQQVRSLTSGTPRRRRSPVRMHVLDPAPSIIPAHPANPPTTSSSTTTKGRTKTRTSSSLSMAASIPPQKPTTPPPSMGGDFSARAETMRSFHPPSSSSSAASKLPSLTTFPMMTAAANDAMTQALLAALASPGDSQQGSASASQGTRRLVQSALFCSPGKTCSSIPDGDDVNAIMAQCFSQNTTDYFDVNFPQILNRTKLADSSSTPSKLARL